MNQKNIVYATFKFTYILLITTGTITFIEAVCTENPVVRHIMNLETCISIVAGYFYGMFLEQMRLSKSMNFQRITITRYIDWCVTTPMMLLTLCLVLGMHTDTPLRAHIYIAILILNYLMLLIGYLGETMVLKPLTSCILGFIPFFLMFALIYYVFVSIKYVRENYILYFTYLFIWSLYGIVYLFDKVTQNICLNILDLVAKCFIGLGLWAYYTKIIMF